VLAPLTASGQVALQLQGSAQVIVDVTGYLVD